MKETRFNIVSSRLNTLTLHAVYVDYTIYDMKKSLPNISVGIAYIRFS